MPVYQKDMKEISAGADKLSELILGANAKKAQIAQQGELDAAAKEAAIGQAIRQAEGMLPVEQQKAQNQANIDHANLRRSVQLAQEIAKAQGMQPGRFSLGAGQNSVNINPEAVDTQGKALEKAKTLANITGYDIANPDAVIPSQKDAEEVKSATAGYRTMSDIGKSMDEKLAERNMLDMLGVYNVPLIGQIGTKRAKAIDADIGSMLMEGKNQQKLGALQESEVRLMEKMQGDVGGIGAAISGNDSARDRLKDYLTKAQTSTKNMATTRGYAPKPGYLDPGKGAKIPAKKMYSPSRNQTKIIYSDGTEEIVDGKQ